ncbi:MAG: lysylphosphatidylglycerol synthase transmembrane domain-containing protein, partial [Chloroflexota bacterium]
YIWIIPALGAYFLGVGVRAVRWNYLLRPVEEVSVPRLFPIVVIGYMANNVLPLRAGELVRAYALSARHGIRKSASLATIAIERLFDGLTMLLFFSIASLTIVVTSDLRTLFYLGSIVFAALTAFLVVLAFAPDTRERVLVRIFGIIPDPIEERFRPMADAFFSGLGILRRRNDLLTVGATSILAWGLEASMYLMIAQGFSLDISPLAILMVTAVANLATLIPSSPGYIGAFEYGVLLVLSGPLGLGRELALSYAVVVHAALYGPVTLLGFVFWWRESLSWKDLHSTGERQAPAT